MLHICVRVVEVDTGEGMTILQGHVIGLNTDDGLPAGQFLNGGIQVQRLLLGEQTCRQREENCHCSGEEPGGDG